MKTLKEHWELYNDGATVNYSAAELGLEYLGFVDFVDYELSEDGTRARISVACSESLAFHREHSPEYFDQDGELTDAAWDALRSLFPERYSADVTEAVDDYLRFNVDLETDASAPAESIGEVIWPTLARIANETDPGTFGSEYLFGTIMADALKERAE